jgi:hypothetical protein
MKREQLDEIARQWHRTKDPKYKEQWYKAVKDYAQFLEASGRVSSLELQPSRKYR